MRARRRRQLPQQAENAFSQGVTLAGFRGLGSTHAQGQRCAQAITTIAKSRQIEANAGEVMPWTIAFGGLLVRHTTEEPKRWGCRVDSDLGHVIEQVLCACLNRGQILCFCRFEAGKSTDSCIDAMIAGGEVVPSLRRRLCKESTGTSHWSGQGDTDYPVARTTRRVQSS